MFEVQQRSPLGARAWFSMRHDIDMEPDYQRAGKIWTDEDKRFLIDSIINEYDIPKIYMADFTTIKSELNYSKKRYAVIDGKQRLEAIFEFLSDNLSLSRKIVFAEDSEVDIRGLRYSDLQVRYPTLAARVENFPLVVVHVVTDEVDRVNQLFVRLNKGASLTGAEIRNAMVGPLPRLIRELAVHSFFQDRTRFQKKRGQHWNAVAKLFLLEMSGEIKDTKKADLDRLVRMSEDADEETYTESYERIEHNLDVMCEVFKNGDELLAAQGNVPVFYWFVRGVEARRRGFARAFLVDFMERLKENRSLEDMDKNADLSAYDLAARSTNDSKAIQRRVDILEEWFRAFLNE